ncbi:MAG: hypothetical protein IT269_12880, partial [Saprospiraceae bacterium]|nr:hypothetical protein [Saprospiraceae bacterium]
MRQTLLAFCCILIYCHPTLAQDKMLERPPFDTIQALLDQGIKQRDLHKQALAWYYWAMHSEQESGLLDSAFQYLNKSVTRFYQAGDTMSAQRARSDLAERVAERGAVAGAIDVHLEALEYFTSRHNLEMETHICARLSRAYDLARDTVKAEYYRRKFKDKNYLLRDTSLDVQVLLQTVEKLHREHRYNIAYYVAFQAYTLAIKAKLPQNQLTYTRLMLGYSAYLDRQYAKALGILKEAERYCHPNDHATRRTIYQRLSQVYEATGNLRNAQYYALRYGTLGDTLLNRDLSRALQLQALQFEDKNIRQAIANLEQEQLQAEKQRKEERLWFGAILFGLGAWMLAAWIFFRDYRHRIHSDRVIAEQNQELSRRYILELEQGQRMETMKGILEGQDSERLRIAQDLHDSVGGMLAATKMQLENLLSRNKGLSKNKDFQNVKKLLDATVLETRHISQNLQPGALKQFGLVNAVRDLTNRLGSTGSTE